MCYCTVKGLMTVVFNFGVATLANGKLVMVPTDLIEVAQAHVAKLCVLMCT